MKAKILLGLVSATIALTVRAEPASYRDNTLTIPSGAVINGSETRYYKDIVLQADSAGKFKIVSAAARPLVYVDSANPTVIETESSRSVEFTIAGNKSVPCTKLEEVAVSRKNEVFTIVIAESVLGPAESCIAMLDPFELKLPLDITGLPAGTYKVVANGVESSFTLRRAP